MFKVNEIYLHIWMSISIALIIIDGVRVLRMYIHEVFLEMLWWIEWIIMLMYSYGPSSVFAKLILKSETTIIGIALLLTQMQTFNWRNLSWVFQSTLLLSSCSSTNYMMNGMNEWIVSNHNRISHSYFEHWNFGKCIYTYMYIHGNWNFARTMLIMLIEWTNE